MNWTDVIENSKIVGEKLVIKDRLAETIEIVKNKFHFNILKEIIAVDNKENGIELIYKLHSVEDEEDVLISINVTDNIESVSQIFESAIADEKEIYDMFGVKFIGNPELKRLYMPEDWQGHPLKKDYTESDERLKWND